MKKITPHLWFDTQAKDAAELYVNAFEDARITSVSVIKDTPSGDCDLVSFEIGGQPFMAISAGPEFALNPSISFMVNFDPSKHADARERLDRAWAALSEGGTALMELGAYPFSPHYGWIKDRYGVTWQLMLTNPTGEERPFVIPSMLFTQDMAGRAEEAIERYCAVFPDGTRGNTARYPAGMEPEKEGTLMFADFFIGGTWIVAMDSAGPHQFAFNEAVSLIIPCDTQEEIDRYWLALSRVPEAEQCGWLKDEFGVSWQVTSTRMDQMMAEGTDEQKERVTKAFLGMKKFDVAALEAAYRGA